MTEELQDKELTDIKYLRARMTGNVGLALDHAYNLGFFDGEKNVVEKIRAEITDCLKALDEIEKSGLNIYLPNEISGRRLTYQQCLEFIDKYKAESENKE